MKICKTCVMPENFPHVTFDKNGVCSYCLDCPSREKAKKDKKLYKKKFESLIKNTRGRGEYDILMCYSGGKDSTYALHLLKDRYRLKILAFSFDNGFIADRAYINIRNVVEKLDVDHIFFKPRFEVLKKIFRAAAKKALYPPKTIERASTICTSCTGMVKYIALRLAIEKRIPLVGFGWSPGQAPISSSILKIEGSMFRKMEEVLKGPMRRIIGPDIDPYFLNQYHYEHPADFPYLVHPLAFSGYNEKKILRHIKKYGWEKPYGLDFNATNCLLNSLADEYHIAKYGFHPYILEIAELVRSGHMTRAEGLRHLPMRKNRVIVNMVKKKLGIR